MSGAEAAPRVELLDEVTPEARSALIAGLQRFNSAATGWPPARGLALLVRSAEGATRGGLIGRTSYGWLTIELVFLPEDLRGGGLGRRILEQAETEAVRRGCHSARVETASFQARGFYERAGYRVFASLERYPDAHESHYLRKDLISREAVPR